MSKATIVFEVEGCPIGVNLTVDRYEKLADGMAVKLTYWELWDLIRSLSDIRKEAAQ